MCSFESHEAMLQRLDVLTKRFPNLAQIGSIGKSSQGRDLAYIKISRDVSQRALLEPMFKVTSQSRLNA
jgi:hypothetical protein